MHEPHVKCYTKGKEHKRFEFGSKVSIAVTQKTGVIVGALNFNSTEHDSKTLEKVLEQYSNLTNKKAKTVYVDRGYRGPKTVDDTIICVPKPDKDISKCDTIDEELIMELEKDLNKRMKGKFKIPYIFFSSQTGYNLQELKDMLWKQLN